MWLFLIIFVCQILKKISSNNCLLKTDPIFRLYTDKKWLWILCHKKIIFETCFPLFKKFHPEANKIDSIALLAKKKNYTPLSPLIMNSAKKTFSQSCHKWKNKRFYSPLFKKLLTVSTYLKRQCLSLFCIKCTLCLCSIHKKIKLLILTRNYSWKGYPLMHNLLDFWPLLWNLI